MLRNIRFIGTLIFILLYANGGLANQITDQVIQVFNCKNCQDDGSEQNSAEWTLIYYLAADNDQEYYADNTLGKLVAGTAQYANHPQIIVFLDRFSTQGIEVLEISNGTILQLATLEELNSADSTVLQDFAINALKIAEHNNIGFVMKSEGFSWRGIGRDNTHDDDMPDQLMTNGDLAESLIAAQSLAGRDIDLIVLEGSIMGFIEVSYELRNAAPVLLASQSKIQPDGLPWDMVIEDLSNTPGMTSQELGIAITDNHIEYYSDKGNNGIPSDDTSTNFAAMTVLDQTQINEVLDMHQIWAETTWLLFDDIYNILPHARDLAEVGGFGEVTDYDYNFDIETFMTEGLRLIEEEGLSFPELTGAAEAYLSAQDDYIVYEKSPSDGFKLKATTGLSIWYPPTWTKYDTRDEESDLFGSDMYYEDEEIALDWVVDSNWPIYLYEYFDRADANLAGNGAEDDEPPKTGVFK